MRRTPIPPWFPATAPAALWLGLALTALPGGLARADLIPDGWHGVDHQVVFEGLDQFPDLRFALHPASLSEDGSNSTEVRQGEPVHWYKLLKPKLYAWPAADHPALKDAFFADPARLQSATTFERISAVRDSDPVRTIRTVYRVTGVAEGRITVQTASETRLGNDNLPVPPASPERGLQRAAGFGLIAMVSIVLLLWLRQRHGRPAAP